MKRKGIILAGGTGSRLSPITFGISKQLLPIYDKPMVYYPLSVLMLSDIREIAIITTPHDQSQFQRLLGDGHQWGLSISYIAQPAPEGLAQAYLLAQDFLAGAPSAMVLGDNIFFGHGLQRLLADANGDQEGASIFGYAVSDPERYGVIEFDDDGAPQRIIEKPKRPVSKYAVTGLYFLDGSAPERAATLVPSARGELEIASLLETYLADGSLTVRKMGRGFAWLDTGTFESLLDASNFVRTLQRRQGILTGSPDEIAAEKRWVTADQIRIRAKAFEGTDFAAHLMELAASM